jgi:trigger factor
MSQNQYQERQTLEVTEKRLENSSTSLEITVPVNIITEHFEKQYKKLQKSAKVDGFRKGKVPIEIIRKKFREAAAPDVVESVIQEQYIKALDELKIEPVDRPKVEFGNFKDDEPFTFTAIVDIFPTVTLGDYKNIPVEEDSVKISDKDIDTEIDGIRQKHATLSVKDDGVAEVGNQVEFESEDLASADENPVRKESVIIKKDSKTHEFDSHLIGMKKNEEKEVELTYGKDYQVESLRGQKFIYKIKITEIYNRTLPALDDDFAKDLGEYETLDALKKKTREDMERYFQQRVRGEAKSRILNKIIEKANYDIPKSLINREKESIQQRMKERYNLQIDDPKIFAALFGTTPEDYDKQLEDEAQKSIKTTLTLSEVGKVEKLEVTDEEYEKHLEEVAPQYQKNPIELKKILEENGNESNVKSDLLYNKTMDFIYDNAKIKKGKTYSVEEYMKQ